MTTSDVPAYPHKEAHSFRRKLAFCEQPRHQEGQKLQESRPDQPLLPFVPNRGTMDAPINAEDGIDHTAPHDAAKVGDCAAIEKVCEQGANLGVTDQEGRTALHLAAGEGHCAAVDLPLRCGADPNALDTRHHETALHQAAYKGHCDVMRLLLDRGADVNTVGGMYQWTVLHSAAEGGYCEALNILLEHRVHIDARDHKTYRTPLICAAQCGNNDAIKVLLEAGADLRGRCLFGWNALHVAAQNGHCDTVSLLLDCGAKVAAKTKDRSTALHWAAQKGHCKVVRLLCSRGADINGKDNEGNTALFHAAWCGHPSVADLAFTFGGRFHERDYPGNTLLHYSPDNSLDTVVYLLSLGLDVNARNNDGETPLHTAVRWNNSAVAEALLMAGAKCGVKDVEGQTPEDVAQKHAYDVHIAQKNTGAHRILVYHKSHFPNLQRSCRLKIRSVLGDQRQDKISQLKLPQALKDYLLFKYTY